MNNSVIKDELTNWLIDCNDAVRVEEVRELKKNQLEKEVEIAKNVQKIAEEKNQLKSDL